MNNWQRLATKIVYQNSYMTVHEDSVVRPDGRPGTYGWIETPPAVFIVAIDDDNKMTLVEQTRYVTGRASWEFPAGSTSGDDPLEAAKRELEEEAGLHADKWVQLTGQTYPFASFAPEYNIVLLATGLHQARERTADTDDFITATKRVSWDELVGLIAKGEVHNGQTISAAMLVGIHLGHIK